MPPRRAGTGSPRGCRLPRGRGGAQGRGRWHTRLDTPRSAFRVAQTELHQPAASAGAHGSNGPNEPMTCRVKVCDGMAAPLSHSVLLPHTFRKKVHTGISSGRTRCCSLQPPAPAPPPPSWQRPCSQRVQTATLEGSWTFGQRPLRARAHSPCLGVAADGCLRAGTLSAKVVAGCLHAGGAAKGHGGCGSGRATYSDVRLTERAQAAQARGADKEHSNVRLRLSELRAAPAPAVVHAQPSPLSCPLRQLPRPQVAQAARQSCGGHGTPRAQAAAAGVRQR